MLLLLFFLFIQVTIGRGISLFDYINNTNYYNVQPFSPIVNTVKVAKKYEIEIYREDSRQAYKHNILGGYRPYSNVIVLYNSPKLEYFDKSNDKTLKHELIHAIQHCNGNRTKFKPIIDDAFLLLCIEQKNINVTFIESFYTKEDFKIELEAYCFETFISYEDINMLLNAFC